MVFGSSVKVLIFNLWIIKTHIVLEVKMILVSCSFKEEEMEDIGIFLSVAICVNEGKGEKRPVA